MKIMRKVLLSLFAIISFTAVSGVANAACGKITIANMNWASANFMAEVDKVILEEDMAVMWNLFQDQQCQHLLLCKKKVSQT